MLFELISKGEHLHSDGKTYTKGQVIETEQPLDKLFANKFKRLDKDEEKEYTRPEIPLAEEGGEKTTSSPPSSSTKRKRSPFGKHISSQFDNTAEAGVKVYIKDHWCTVVDSDSGEAVSTKKLRKKDVQDFIDGLLSQEDSAEVDSEVED